MEYYRKGVTMQVYIMRGLPGSGKSTWISRHANNPSTLRIVSADKYHVNSKGVYEYKLENAKAAHDNCLLSYMESLLNYRDLINRGFGHLNELQCIYVDNTNTSVWEIAPYYRLAEIYGHKVEIVQFICSVETSLIRNIHKVPPSTIWKMYQNLLTEKLPPHWNLTIIASDQDS